MTLRLTDEQDALLTAWAKSQGISKNEAAIRAIAEVSGRDARRAMVRAAWAG